VVLFGAPLIVALAFSLTFFLPFASFLPALLSFTFSVFSAPLAAPEAPPDCTEMGKKKKGRPRARKESAASVDYADSDGNILTLRQELTPGTIAKVNEDLGRPGASAEDGWQRRQEMLFERLAVKWEISGLPLDEQATLLGRLRMASSEERDWVRATIDKHLERFIPELIGSPGL
jgi:hypothetical protein